MEGVAVAGEGEGKDRVSDPWLLVHISESWSPCERERNARFAWIRERRWSLNRETASRFAQRSQVLAVPWDLLCKRGSPLGRRRRASQTVTCASRRVCSITRRGGDWDKRRRTTAPKLTGNEAGSKGLLLLTDYGNTAHATRRCPCPTSDPCTLDGDQCRMRHQGSQTGDKHHSERNEDVHDHRLCGCGRSFKYTVTGVMSYLCLGDL